MGFGLLLTVAGDRDVLSDGRHLQAITKSRRQSVYDGHLFHDIAAQNGH
ncbi:MAG: hypothetical protein H7338_02260 [Candidatus Sericytochromatia bacterium]|nr:hypothetical protein [Candidatus Sericytochromatia bacterium]